VSFSVSAAVPAQSTPSAVAGAGVASAGPASSSSSPLRLSALQARAHPLSQSQGANVGAGGGHEPSSGGGSNLRAELQGEMQMQLSAMQAILHDQMQHMIESSLANEATHGHVHAQSAGEHYHSSSRGSGSRRPSLR